MNDRRQVIEALRDEFNRWESLLAGLSEAQIIAPQWPSGWSIKDVVAHLRAWQQVSIARLEAAVNDAQPEMPDWLDGQDPESEVHIDEFNARIYESNRDRAWPEVHDEWRNGFLRFLELSEAIPEERFFDEKRYPWLKGYALADVLLGSREHHHVDHLEPLLAWFRRGGVTSAVSAACSVAPMLSVRNGTRAVEFYKSAFGAIEVYHVEDPSGSVVSRLSVEGAEFWLSDESPEHGNFSPESLGGGTVRMILTVPDPDAMFAKALAAGARQVFAVEEAHGWRLGRLVDPFGHHWEIGRPLAS